MVLLTVRKISGEVKQLSSKKKRIDCYYSIISILNIIIIRYGEPIIQTIHDLEAFHEEPKAVVKSLTDRIAKGVECSTINSPDW